MGLITDEQKKNAQVKTPTIKAVKTAPISPTEGLTPAAVPQEMVQDESLLPKVQEPAAIPQPQQEEQPDSGSFVFPSQAPEPISFDVNPQPTLEQPKTPAPSIAPTVPIWKDLTPEYGDSAYLKPEVSSTTLPSFSVSIPDNSTTINKAFYGTQNAIGNFNSDAQKQQYAAAQAAKAQVMKPGAQPNTPDATKPWYSAPIGFMSDILFGTEKAKKESEAGIPDAGSGSFGRAGAGVGGAINYGLSVLPSLFVGAAGEVTKGVANGLQAIGVDKKSAEGFARDGFLNFLPDNIGGGSGYSGVGTGSLKQGGLNVGALKPSHILKFNFDSANKRNLLVDAIAGDPLSDINDPDGSVKYGRIYTRSQRTEAGLAGAVKDPVGLALQIGSYIFNPGEIPGDRFVSAGIHKLFSAFKKPASVAAEAVGKVSYPALPSSAMRAEAQLAKKAERARTATAGRQIFAEEQPQKIGLDLSQTNEEQLNRLQRGTPQLPGTPDVNGAIEFKAPLEVSPPRLDYGEATIEYPTQSKLPTGANPTEVPRAYIGSTEVTRQALPPAFDPADIPEKAESYLLPYSSPAKTALDVGIGNANFRVDKPGALAIRPLEQVIESLREVKPKLLEGFDGGNWEDFKAHISTRVDDIGQVSSVGEDLSNSFQRPIRQVSMGRIRESYFEQWKTDRLTSGGVNLFAKPEEKAKDLLGEGAVVQKFDGYNIVSKAATEVPPQHLEAIKQADAILESVGLKTDVPTDVIFDSKAEGGEWLKSKEVMVIGNTDDVKFTYLHEYAHKLEYLIKSKGKEGHEIFDSFVKSPITKGFYPTVYASERRFKPNEQWAEAIASYLSDKEALKQRYPQYAQEVEDSISKIKTLLADESTTNPGKIKPHQLEDNVDKRLSLTVDRIRKVRGIRETVDKNSGEAVGAIDRALAGKAKVNEAINSYDTLAKDAINNVLLPMQQESEQALKESADEIRAMIKSGAPPEQIEQATQVVEKYSDSLSQKIQTVYDQVQEVRKASENLRGNDLAVAEMRYNVALKDLRKTKLENDLLLRNVRAGEDFISRPSSLYTPNEDDLLTAAEELAQHKLALEQPLNQLNDLFDTTVDFGRKSVDSVPYDLIENTAALRTVATNGTLKLNPNIFVDTSREGLKLKDAWLHSEYNYIRDYARANGFTFEQLLSDTVERNNIYITQANKVAKIAPSPEALTKIEGSLYHGTALDSWTPPENLYVNGSRGELGHGTYFTLDKNTATDYAQARVGDNVSPKTFDIDVNPTVAEVTHNFSATLDARKPLPKDTLKQAFNDLPPNISKKFTAALNRKKKPLSYIQMRSLMEESFVKAGVEPTEEILQQIDADVSKNLRKLGFDSVADNQSGFVLSLDNTRVQSKALENVPQVSAIDAAKARYNADAFASKHYDSLLTTDANLRDSSYKFLSQLHNSVDEKLAQTQEEIIKRGVAERPTVLPDVSVPTNKPKSFVDAIDELTIDDICGI